MHKHVHSQTWAEKVGPVSCESKPSTQLENVALSPEINWNRK